MRLVNQGRALYGKSVSNAAEVSGMASAFGMLLFILFLNVAVVSMSGGGQGHDVAIPYHRYVTAAGIFYSLWFAGIVMRILQNAWPYVLYLLFVALSISWAQSASDAFQVTRYFVASFAGALCAAVATGGNLRLFFQWTTPYLLAILVISIYLCRTQPGVYIDAELGRWAGVTSHPNGLGVAALATVWCSLSLFVLSPSTMSRLLAVASIGASIICLKGTDSVTSAIASIAAAVTFFYLIVVTKLSARLRAMFICAALLFFFSVSTVLVLWPETFPIDKAFALAGRDTSFTGRTALWRIALELFYSKPLFGWGFDHLREGILTHRMDLRHLHNGYLDLLARGGLVGVSLVFATITILIVRIFNTMNKNRVVGAVLASGLIMILIHNIAQGSFGTGLNILWLLYSFLFLHTSIKSQDRTAPTRAVASSPTWKNILA